MRPLKLRDSAALSSAADKANALQALEAEARKLWWLAYNADIVAGAQTAASMLRNGPTGVNVAAAVMVGLLPFGQPWNPLVPISRAGFSPFDFPFPLVPIDGCPLDDETQNNIINGAVNGMQAANAFQLPFKQALQQMLGDAVGNTGVDIVNDDTGVCVTPVDLPQPPEPPKPQPEPSGGGGVLDWLGNARDDVNDWVDQAVDDVGSAIEDQPSSPFGPGPGPGPAPAFPPP